MVNISLFTGFPTCWVVSRISEPSTVWLGEFRGKPNQKGTGPIGHWVVENVGLEDVVKVLQWMQFEGFGVG